MDAIVRDLSYALRWWRRRPGPVLAATVALALGIGANTAVFSVVSGVLLRPLPYEHPDRLVMVWQDMRARGGPAREWASPGTFNDWRERATVFEHLAAVRGWQPNLTDVPEPERLRGAAVSWTYFAALGVPPIAGLPFSAADDAPGGAPVAILSHALWVRRFAGDRAIVGRTISLDGQPTTIAGIMPASFRPPIIQADIWSPIRINPANAPRGMIVLRVIGKLAAGVTVAQARAAMAAIAIESGEEDPEWRGARVAIVSLHDDMVGALKPVLFVLTGAVALVLLIACANVASLLLARASERAREITIRVALGAGRGRIIRQLLAESLLVASAGGVLGVLIAWWGLRSLIAAAPASVPRLQEAGLDGVVLLFALAVTLASAVVSGLAPALATSRVELTPALGERGRESTSGRRMHSAMVVVEVTLAMVLVVGAALMIQSLVALQRVDLGFQPDRVMTASIAPPRARYRGEEPLRLLYSQILERARRLPGVESAAMTSVLPMSGMDSDFTFDIRGRPPAATPAEQPSAWFRIVSPQYFAAIGMRVVAGRGVTPEDRAGSPPVVVVNETLARRYWARTSPLGAKVQVEHQDAVVVGVIADSHHRGPSTPPEAEMYLSYEQFSARGGWIVLRTREEPGSIVSDLRGAVREADPNLPLALVAPMSQLVDQSLAQPRFLTALLTAFSGLAAALALVGIYSVLSLSVSRRAREIGVRMALGAERGAVVRLVLWQTVKLAGAGIVLGGVLSIVLSRVMQTLLFEVRPGDPATVIGMSALVAAAAVAASYAPARRASLVDPVVALRED